MPLRNLVILFAACAFSLLCYLKAPGNYYAMQMARAMRLVATESLEPAEPRDLFENAMQGMLRELDPYSQYLPPARYEPLQQDLDQEFGGIGVVVELDPDTKQLIILSPSVDSPAARAGIRAGDVIVSIDGQLTKKFSMADAVERIRGKPGTPVRLGVLHRDAEEVEEVEVERAIIAVPSVLGDTRTPEGDWRFVLESHPRVGYIRVESFGEQTTSELREALESIRGDVDALVLDLRNNAGGLLSAAVATCDMFLSGGVIVSTRERGGVVREQFEARPGVVFPLRPPLAVLVNGYSASASEIVAACLQDHGRAVVVGERTWGKGTVQNIYPFEAGRSALKLTVASYWRPSGVNIHRLEGMDEQAVWGVAPNRGFEVQLDEDAFVAVLAQRRRRDLGQPADDATPPAADPQLQRALEYVTPEKTGS